MFYIVVDQYNYYFNKYSTPIYYTIFTNETDAVIQIDKKRNAVMRELGNNFFSNIYKDLKNEFMQYPIIRNDNSSEDNYELYSIITVEEGQVFF